MFKLIFLLNYLVNIVFAIKISSQLGDFSFVLLNSNLLLLELLLQFDNSLILFDLCNNLLLLLSLPLLLSNFVHLRSQLLQLSLQLDVLFDQFGLTALLNCYAPFYDINV